MNFFNIYLEKIKKSTIKNKKKLDFKENQILNKIIVETPPENFDCDLSTNIALILAKKTNQNPKIIADKIKAILIHEIKHFSSIDIAGPGFLNIKLSKSALIENINSILSNNENYCS